MSDRWQPGPTQLSPPDGEVHLWLVDLDTAAALPLGALTRPELERQKGMRDATDRRRWANSRWALRETLGRYLGQPLGEIALALAEHGKPELAAPRQRLEFNLSHSAGFALVAVADTPVGVDVEWVGRERNFLALAERELDSNVVAALSAAAPDERAPIFYAAWTRHEARLKCHGGGLGGPRPTEPIAVTDLAVAAEHAAALAVPGDTPPAVRLYRLDLR